MPKENEEQFENRMLAEGWTKKGFGWRLKTKSGCVIIYNKPPKIRQIPHAFLGIGLKKKRKKRRGRKHA